MLYVGIDQRARPITISIRDEGGDVIPARQVSTPPDQCVLCRPDTRESQ